MLENDLYTLLSTNLDMISALDGNANNIWKGFVPKGQPTDPALVFQVVYTQDFIAAEGVLNGHRKRVQFDSYSATYTKTNQVSDTVKRLVQNLTGSLGTTVVQGSYPVKEMDLGLEQSSGGYVYRRLLQVDFLYHDIVIP
jgi:hypothetical protein